MILRRSVVMCLVGCLVSVLVAPVVLAAPADDETDYTAVPVVDDVGDLTLGMSGDLVVRADTVILAQEADVTPYVLDSPIAGGPYIEAETVELGAVKIYVPVDYQRASFSLDSRGNLVNIRSGTISGMLYRGSTPYTFRCSSYSNPQYRSVTGSSTYYDLTVRDIVSSNVQIVRSDMDLPLMPDRDQLILICILLLGVMCICRFMML